MELIPKFPYEVVSSYEEGMAAGRAQPADDIEPKRQASCMVRAR